MKSAQIPSQFQVAFGGIYRLENAEPGDQADPNGSERGELGRHLRNNEDYYPLVN